MADPQGEAPNASVEKRTSKGPDPLIGRVINDRFRVVALIARGGMGKVYRAEQAPLGREVALKVLHPNYNGENDPEFHKRFFLEASTCSKLTHPNTVTIFDYGRTDDDVYYIAMELLEGRTLHRALRDDGPLPASRAMHIARQVCRSLREAHGLGTIHRDLKPANIFLMKHGDETDFVKVLDFGLVKDLRESGEELTQTGLFMGSPKYMSPEQIRGEKVDGRADIYALGVILYEMITGKVPFDRPNSVNILMAHVHEPPPPLREINPSIDVPPLVEQIVYKALAKDTAERFASMDEMLIALNRTALDAGMSLTRSTDLGMSGEFAAIMTGPHAPVSITGTPVSGARVAMPSVPPTLHAAPARKKRTPIWIAIALIAASVLLGSAIAAAMMLGTDDEPTQVAAPTEPRSIPPPANETITRAADVARALVVLRSTPPGATVRIGDQTFGPTPADIEWTGDDAAMGRRVTFRFELDGYRDYSVTRVITGDRLEVAAELEAIERVPERPNRPRRPRPPREQGDEPVGPVKGYKLDPY